MTAESDGLTARQRREIESVFRRVLGGRFQGKVYLFGSRARGDHRRYSDADLLVDADVDERPLRDVRDALADGGLPFKCDVVLARDVFEPYRGQIEAEKIPLFEL